MHLQALVDVRLDSADDADGFERLVAGLPQITEVLCLAGRVDYHVRVECAGPGELERVLHDLGAGGAAETETRLVLHAVPVRVSAAGSAAARGARRDR